MKTKEQIEQVLEAIKKDWENVDQIPDYIRGQYVILKWVLDEEVR